MDLGLKMDGGTLRRVPPNADKETQTVILNEVIDRLNILLKTQTLADGGTKRFIQGYQKNGWPGGDFGMKIAAPGDNVLTAAAVDLLFSWDFSTGTMYWNYNGINYRQDGILPNGDSGLIIAEDGFNVADVI